MENMLRVIRSSSAEEVGGDPEVVIRGIRKFVQERRAEEKGAATARRTFGGDANGEHRRAGGDG